MLDSHYHPGVRITTEVGRARNTFYAIFLRHLEYSLNLPTVGVDQISHIVVGSKI
jgi:hypothetical protein